MFARKRWAAAGVGALAMSVFAGSANAQFGNEALTPDQEAQVRQNLIVSDFLVEHIDVGAEVGEAFVFPVVIDNDIVDIWLEPRSVRADGFVVYTIGDDGLLVDAELPESQTYIGHIMGDEGSRVAASFDGASLSAVLVTSNDVVYGINPLSDALEGADPALHVVYAQADIIEQDVTCGVPDDEVPPPAFVREQPQEEIISGTANFVCEIAFDADFQFYQQNGSSVPNTILDIERVLNGMDFIYNRDVDIVYELTTIIIRTSSGSNPYTSSNSSTLLNQFRSVWNSNFSGIKRDVAHLMTGRNLNGSIIGIAFLSQICNLSQAYGLSESRFTTNFTFRVALTAHELGHNWSAQHCNNFSNCRIMCSGLGGCTGVVSSFGPTSISSITNFRGSRGCLTFDPGPFSLPFFDDFPIFTIDTQKWRHVDGATITQNGVDEPSTGLSLELDAANSQEFFDDEIRSAFIDASGVPAVVFSYFVQHRGVDAGEALNVEILNSDGDWELVNRLVSDGVDEDTYTQFQHVLTGDQLSDELRVRFRTEVNSTGDNWFVDDVFVGEDVPEPIALPFVEQFPDTTVNTDNWSRFEGVINGNAVNEPSAPNSAELDGSSGGEEIETQAILAGGVPLMELTFAVQSRGNEAGESLIVEYFDNIGQWVQVTEIVSDGTTENDFTDYEFFLAGSASHDDLRLRFRSTANSSGDDFFIDDIVLSEFVGGEECPPDWDGNGIVNAADVGAFLSDYFTDLANGTLVTDYDENGVVNAADVGAFLGDYFAFLGDCP